MNQSKHLIFYISALASAIILFALVSAYGEANLKASIKIDGIYKITSKLDCQNLNPVLAIHQSGIYLSADLIAPETSESQVFGLTGKLNQQQIFLAGKSTYCAAKIVIKGEFAGKYLNGKITINDATTDFISTKIAAKIEIKKETEHPAK